MTLADYFKTHGRGAAYRLTVAIGSYTSDMSTWTLGRRKVPVERCIDIERATAGQVRCEDLRPDIDWAVLRQPAPKAQTESA